MTDAIELGLETFGDVTLDPNGQPLPQAQVLRNVVAEAILADQVGLHFFGVGEHHRPDVAVAAPEVVLAAIAGQPTQILGTARRSRIYRAVAPAPTYPSSSTAGLERGKKS